MAGRARLRPRSPHSCAGALPGGTAAHTASWGFFCAAGKYPVEMMEADVRAIIAGKPLPPPTLAFLQAWEDAKREATKSEYAFKPGLNYYTFGSPAS